MIMPLISTAFIVISAILVAMGWYYIIKGNVEAHKKTMTFAGVFAVGFFIIYISRTIILGNTVFAGPSELKLYYTVFLIFHIFLATTGAVFGAISLTSGYKNNMKLHRKIGPITSVIWFFSAITGVMVFLALYIIWPSGQTASMIKAIWGF